MKFINEILEFKPSKAIRAMIAGLKKNQNRIDFKINMDIYGDSIGNICIGCAATCAVEQIANKKFSITEIHKNKTRAEAMKIDKNDLWEFEQSIDSLREGLPEDIFSYMYLTYDYQHYPNVPLPVLQSNTWMDNLEPYEKYAEQLETLGL